MAGLIRFLFLFLELFAVNVYAQVDIRYEITEESSPRTFGNLAQDLSLDLPSDVTYRFLSVPDIAVTITADTGDLNISARIDRDSICPGQDQCFKTLDVAISSGDTLTVQKKIEIVIQDINDNVPLFTPSVYVLPIPESASVGRSFSGLPSATDKDSPRYGIQGIEGYTLTDSTGTFTLQVENKDGHILYLVLLKPLDRETTDSITLEITAMDGSQLSGQLIVVVEVKDSNDHPPEFEESSYQTSVEENLPLDTIVLTVKATDHDIGPNGQIIYSFRATTLTDYGSIFGINNKTGDIFLTGTIDYETSSVYILTIIAEDQGSDSIPVDARVTINVLDQNDCRPEIQINTLSTSNTDRAEVVEELDTGAFVAQVLVTDKDSGNNGKVTCNINDNVFRLEEIIVNVEYNIETATKIDREHHNVYNLAIICSDQGSEPHTSIKQLRVEVSDVNDHRPVFEEQRYATEIYENNDRGLSLITVSATDLDTGPNSYITYEISSQIATQIQIDPLSGLIQAKASLDREAEPGGQIQFYATAKDNGDPQLSTSVQVVITLKDINDEAPYFDKPVYSFHVTEESAPYVIGSVHAVDPDSIPNNLVSYNLIESGSGAFIVGSESGELRTVTSLDRERHTEMTLVVTASDSGNPPQVSTAFVTVRVDDINDNTPRFIFPKENNNTVYISNDLKKGSKFAQIIALDEDTGLNGQVTYGFVESVHIDLFSIDSLTGSVYMISDMSHISFQEYDLVVLAHDQGTPSNKNVSNLKVVVNESLSGNEQKPNKTTVIIVGCVAAVIIVILIISIACIYYHKKSLKSDKRQKFIKALTLLTSVQNQRELKKPDLTTSYQVYPSGAISIRNMDNITQRTSSVQDSGLDNSGIMNRSWSSLNGFQLQDDRDNGSVEGSNADSGCVPSEPDEQHSSFAIRPIRMEDPPLKPAPIGIQFDSPGRKLLYTKTTAVPVKQECRRSHPLSQSFTEQKTYNDQWSESHKQSHHSSSQQVNNSHSARSPSLHYILGHCSSDVYV